ncbi:MAG: protein kinase [Planctomycetes bacterium]|nr:protein kinase [Planctomycetota bacterium]
MCPQEAEFTREEEERLSRSSRADLVKTLSCTPIGARTARQLEEVERIRLAFESAGAGKEAPPDFPGYVVIEKLGQGGFGAVYRARDEKLGREVALKVLLPRLQLSEAARERFLKEARALALLRHPNILTIHAVLEHRGRIGLVTEFIDGQPFNDLISQRGPLSAREAAQVGVEVCRALAAAHALQLIHRDVKSANILRERGGRIVLTDFGLGVFVGAGSNPEERMKVAGSPLFMAPEQVRGGEVDARTDIYALGIVLYHLSAGTYPVEPCDLEELFSKIKAGALKPLRDLRPDLAGEFVPLVQKALAVEPAQRYQSAGEFERALLDFLAGEGAPASRAAPYRAMPGGLSRRPKILLAFMGGLAALILAAAILGGSGLWSRLFNGSGSARLLEVRAAALKRDTASGKAEALFEGDRVRKDDQLFFEFEAGQDCHVYVLNEDARGSRNLLFPCAGGALKNPLPGGKRHELPGLVGGQKHRWAIDTAGGQEWIIVIASLKPLDRLGELAAAPAELAVYPEVKAEALQVVVRGMTVAPQKKEAVLSGSARLETLIEELKSAAGAEPGADLWIRKIPLANP